MVVEKAGDEQAKATWVTTQMQQNMGMYRKTVKLELIAKNKSLNAQYVCDPESFQTIFLHIEVYAD